MDTTGLLRPLVPKALRHPVFDSIHSLAHAGVSATYRMLSSRYVWPGCAADAARWVRDCQNCARGKPGIVQKADVVAIPIPAARFSHVHVDIVGPLPRSSKGHSYVLTMVDRATRWPEVVPLVNITAEEVADSFVDTWVARYGVPATVTTDKGRQFTSSTWACLCTLLGINHHHLLPPPGQWFSRKVSQAVERGPTCACQRCCLVTTPSVRAPWPTCCAQG